MGIRNKDIVVKNLTHLAGIISCLINGKAFSVALPAMTANTLYMVYFVPGTGLVISTNVNSVGPAGAAAGFFLIGAFYSNGLAVVAFGSFVTITGTPLSGPIDHLITVTGFAAPTPSYKWYRQGPIHKAYVDFSGGASSGVGAGFNLPFPSGAGVTRNAGKWNADATIFSGVLYIPQVAPSTASFANDAGNWAVNLTGNAIGTGSFITANIEYPVAAWSNTPIIDL